MHTQAAARGAGSLCTWAWTGVPEPETVIQGRQPKDGSPWAPGSPLKCVVAAWGGHVSGFHAPDGSSSLRATLTPRSHAAALWERGRCCPQGLGERRWEKPLQDSPPEGGLPHTGGAQQSPAGTEGPSPRRRFPFRGIFRGILRQPGARLPSASSRDTSQLWPEKPRLLLLPSWQQMPPPWALYRSKEGQAGGTSVAIGPQCHSEAARMT